MNETINLLKNHRSIRSYKPDSISQDKLDEIITSAMAAANWINGQQVTVIAVQEKNKKAKLAELVGNQAYVDEAPVFLIFCIDYHRAEIAAEKNNSKIEITDSVEALLTGATDVGIALGNAIAAAESLGLGTVAIGGIRKNPHEVIELLNLPKYVFPISGLVVGYPKDESSTKPRLPLEATYHKEQYHEENMEQLINQYDEEMRNYIEKRTNGTQSRDWSSGIAQFYSNSYKNYLHVSDALKKQGFNNQ